MKNRNIVIVIILSTILIITILYFLRAYNLLYKPIFGVIYNKETNSIWKLHLLPNTAIINKWEPFYSIKLDLKYYTIIDDIEYLGQSSESEDTVLQKSNRFRQDVFQDTLKIKTIYKGQFYEVQDTLDFYFFSGSWGYFKNKVDRSNEILLINLILQPTTLEYTNWKFKPTRNEPIFFNNCLLIRGESYFDVPDIRYPIF